MSKILLAGDSFAADWQVKHPDQEGWVNLLAKEYDVTNVAQAAVSEYKILKQITSVDLTKFDTIIVSHATPNRLHCETHPIHSDDKLHGNADLIYQDLVGHTESDDAQTAVKFFERYFETEYYKYTSNLICMDILRHLGEFENLNQIHLENYKKVIKYTDLPAINFNPIFSKHRGLMNHLDNTGNQLMLDKIKKCLLEQETQ